MSEDHEGTEDSGSAVAVTALGTVGAALGLVGSGISGLVAAVCFAFAGCSKDCGSSLKEGDPIGSGVVPSMAADASAEFSNSIGRIFSSVAVVLLVASLALLMFMNGWLIKRYRR